MIFAPSSVPVETLALFQADARALGYLHMRRAPFGCDATSTLFYPRSLAFGALVALSLISLERAIAGERTAETPECKEISARIIERTSRIRLGRETRVPMPSGACIPGSYGFPK